jgi:hypothetical protein
MLRCACTSKVLFEKLQLLVARTLNLLPLGIVYTIFSMFGSNTEKREDHEHLLPDEERSSVDSQPSRLATRGPSWSVTIITIVCTAVISAAFGALIAQQDRLSADDFSIRHTSQYCQYEMSRGTIVNADQTQHPLSKTWA